MKAREDGMPRLAELFADAIELDEVQRVAFVERARTEDAARAAELEALLAAHGRAEGMAARLDAERAFALLHDELPDEAAPSRELGPWRLMHELGVGGMGVVYLAERNDGAYEQRVALKMLPWGLRSPPLQQRFLLERRILARLEHPSIARLVDGGVADTGDPWLAMELVDGVRITNWCDDRSAPVDTRLSLFCRVCEAVEYAHGRLVVHRDLKPANILVTDDGALKLLDFGIAKLITDDDEDTEITRQGLRPYTPGYAAPEQRSGGEITVATDVYSLGAVLHELLTGRPPAADGSKPTAPSMALTPASATSSGAGDSGAATTAATPDPESVASARGLRPQQLSRRLSGDLDTIVMQALHEDPERRYASVQAMREDVQRYRDGRPIQARPDSVAYRAAKFLRRHRLGAAAAMLVMVSLVGGLAATTWQARVAAAARGRAEQEADRARLEAEKAQQVSTFLADLFRDADPERSNAQNATARELLDLGAARLDTELQDQPEVQANLQAIVGQAYMGMGLFDEARSQFERALATNSEHPGVDQVETARTLTSLGSLEYRIGNYEAAQGIFERALRIYDQVEAPDPGQVAAVLNNLGLLQRRFGDLDQALSSFDRAAELYIEAQGPEDSDVGRALNNKGLVLADLGRYEEARSAQEQALAIHEAAYGPEHIMVAGTLNNLAETRRRVGDTEGVEELLRRSLAIVESLMGPDHANTATAYDSLGRFLAGQERYDEAIAAHQTAADTYARALGPDHPYVAYPLMGLGNIEHGRGHPEDALPYFERALVIREQAFGAEHLDVASSLASIGAARFDLADHDGAQEPMERALAIRRAQLPGDHSQLSDSLTLLARLAVAREECARAVPLLEEAAAIRAATLAEDDPRRVEVADLLARCAQD